MTELFLRSHRFLVRRRPWVILLLVLFALTAGFLAPRLKLNQDFTDMLPMSEPAIAEQVEALKYIRQADRLFIDVQVTSSATGQLADAADRLATALQEIPGLGDLRYKIDASDLMGVYEGMQAQLPGLLNSKDLSDLEARLQPAAVEKRLSWLKTAISQPQGMVIKRVAQTDPIGLSDPVSARLRALQAGLGDARIVGGCVTSADGRHILISAAPASPASALDQSSVLMQAVLKAARSVEGLFPPQSVHIAITGAHRMALDNATLIREDTTRTSVLATLAVAGLLLAAYRRRWFALLALAPTLFGAFGTILVFYCATDSVSAVALGCGSILIGVTVDYGIYILYHTDDWVPVTREQLARLVARLAPAVSFGALTTMAAFGLMFFSPVPGHRQLGLFGAGAVSLAAAFSLLILPLFVPTGHQTSGRALPLTALMQQLFDWRDRHARLVLGLVLLLSAACAVGAFRLRFDGDLARLNGVSPATRDDEATIRETWGKSLSLTTVVVYGRDQEQVLRQNEQVCESLRTLQTQQRVEAFSSIAPLLPSTHTQELNRRQWQLFWTEARRRTLANSLASAAATLGFRTNAFQPFLRRFASLDGLPASAATNGWLPRALFKEYYSEKDGQLSLCTLVKVTDRASYRQVREKIQAAVPGALLVNKSALADEIARTARRALPMFALVVTASNAALLFVLLGRLELVLTTLLPMGVGVFWTLGSLGLLGLPIDMSNFIFVIFVIGVGGDYSLFLVMAHLEPFRGYRERTATTGVAVALCALTTLMGVGVLVLARHPALFSVGLTALLGISFSLLATLCLVPLCLKQLERGTLQQSEVAVGSRAARPGDRRRQVWRLYRFQGPCVSQFVYWKLKLDPLFKTIDAVVPRGRILDLGCGRGIVAHWLSLCSQERTVLGVDHDDDNIRVAQATAPQNRAVHFEQHDIVSWGEYPDCDCVLLCDVLHYLPRELKIEVLRKAHRALPSGGCLVVRDACSQNGLRHRLLVWAEQCAVWLGQNKAAYGLCFETSEEHLTLLTEAGFSDIRVTRSAGLGSNFLMIALKR